MATGKEHLAQTQQNVCSTRAKTKKKLQENYTTKTKTSFPQKHPMLQLKLFCFTALDNEIKGDVYTDLPGQFPTQSYKVNKYTFLAYIYDTNAILVRPTESRSKDDMIAVFTNIYDFLKRTKLQNFMSWTMNALKPLRNS